MTQSLMQTNMFDNWHDFPARLDGLVAPIAVWEHLRWLQSENGRLRKELETLRTASTTATAKRSLPSPDLSRVVVEGE